MKCLLHVAIFAALALLAIGCATTQREKEALSGLEPNTLVIENRTPYYLSVLRNGKPWINQEELVAGQFHLPFALKPAETLMIKHPTSYRHERVVLDLVAKKGIRVGCLLGEEVVWRRSWTLELGTNKSACLITARSRH